MVFEKYDQKYISVSTLTFPFVGIRWHSCIPYIKTIQSFWMAQGNTNSHTFNFKKKMQSSRLKCSSTFEALR